jgi:hypothetical protein
MSPKDEESGFLSRACLHFSPRFLPKGRLRTRCTQSDKILIVNLFKKHNLCERSEASFLGFRRHSPPEPVIPLPELVHPPPEPVEGAYHKDPVTTTNKRSPPHWWLFAGAEGFVDCRENLIPLWDPSTLWAWKIIRFKIH